MEGAPWAASAQSYAGWIPNVGNHLSFSMIGEGKGPGVERFSQAFDGRTGRFVAAFQHRPTDDFLLPPSAVRRGRPGIVQRWLLVGSTVPVHVASGLSLEGDEPQSGMLDEQGMLVGSIRMVAHERDERRRAVQDWGMAEVRRLLRSAGDRFMVGHDLSDRELERLEAELDRVVRWRAPSAKEIRFALLRSGELRLWFEDDQAPSAKAAAARRTMARQAYFFLKDMVHHHTHHDSSSDQITPLVQVNASTPERRASGERKWRRETAWSLSRTAETLVRSGNLDDKRQAMGMLAYADAFQKALLGHARHHEDPTLFVAGETIYGFDFAHMRESLKVQIERSQVRRTHTTAMLVAGLASSIAALSLLSSSVSTRNAIAARHDPPVDSLRFGVSDEILRPLAAHPASVVAIVFLVVLLISAIVTDNGANLLRSGPRRLAQGLRGLTLSFARLVGGSAGLAHRALIACYAAAIVALTMLAFWIPTLIREVLPHL